MSQRSDTGMSIVLPEVGAIEFPMHNATVTQDEKGILIKFHKEAEVHKEVEDECILDLCAVGITGIEPLPYTHIGGKEVIKPFINRHVPDVLMPRM